LLLLGNVPVFPATSLGTECFIAGGEVEFSLTKPSLIDDGLTYSALHKQFSSCSDNFDCRRRRRVTNVKEALGESGPRSEPCLPGDHGGSSPPRSDWETFANLAQFQDFQAVFLHVLNYVASGASKFCLSRTEVFWPGSGCKVHIKCFKKTLNFHTKI
jgi:hypothetical protein